MEPESLLQSLCERHGVQPSRGESLLPLIQWALKGPEESRKRILEVVERAIQDESNGHSADPIELSAAADQAVLVAVARVLHNWTPDNTVIEAGLGAQAGEGEAEEPGDRPSQRKNPGPALLAERRARVVGWKPGD